MILEFHLTNNWITKGSMVANDLGCLLYPTSNDPRSVFFFFFYRFVFEVLLISKIRVIGGIC